MPCQLLIREKELDKEMEVLRIKACENELELKRLELRAKQENFDLTSPTGSFDVSKNIKLVPPFIEKYVEKYFLYFQNVVTTLKWPKEAWTLLIQSTLTGRAQGMYSSLLEHSSNYDEVKTSILRVYELVPEAYRQHFRQHRKSERQTYVEFVREKKFCSIAGVLQRK